MSLGHFLRDRRNELGKSVEQISAATRIHARILSALEEDRYSDLPARTFTRGFITSYCKALRLDPEQIFRDYHDFLEEKFQERHDRDQGHQGYVFEGKEIEQNKRGMVIGAGAAIVFLVSTLLVFKPQNHKRKEKHKEFISEDAASTSGADDADSDEVITTDPTSSSAVATSSSPKSPPAAAALAAAIAATGSPAPVQAGSVASSTGVSTTGPTAASPTPAPTATPTATPAPTATPQPSPSATPAADAKKDPLNKGDELGPKEFKKKIAFEASEDAFVRYRADGKTPMEFMLRKGKFLVIKARETITFETRNPEALRYRTKSRDYKAVPAQPFSVADDGSLQPQ